MATNDEIHLPGGWNLYTKGQTWITVLNGHFKCLMQEEYNAAIAEGPATWGHPSD